MTFNSAPSSPSCVKLTLGVVGPVLIGRLVAVLSVALVVFTVLTKSKTLFGVVVLLVLLTTTLNVVTVAVKPAMPLKVALPTSTFNAM